MFKNYIKSRCYIIAEIGGNFINFDQAKRMIDEAHACDVDAIKLQTYKANTLSSKKAKFNFENTGDVFQYELFKKYEIDEKLHKKVFEYASTKNLDWFSTPSHESDVDMLEKLGCGAYKIGSDDACNLPFLKYIARIGKPILLSTGMCTMEEVRESVATILEEGNDKLFLLHCTSSYPTNPKNVNLMAIQSMISEFSGITIGYSDHTLGINACICAAAIGAKIIEKHFTYDKKAEGPDHLHSANSDEMTEIVKCIREFEEMKGNGIKCPAESEKKSKINTRKSIVLKKNINNGETIQRDAIAVKRPGYGIQPKYIEHVIGRKINKDMEKDDILNWDDL